MLKIESTFMGGEAAMNLKDDEKRVKKGSKEVSFN